MEERFKYIHFKSEFFYNLLILNPSNYIKLIKIQITVNVFSKRRLDQDPIKPVRPSLKHPFFNNPIPLPIDAVLRA